MRKAAFILLGIFLLAVVVSAEEPMVTWKSKRLTLSAEARVGSELLPAGEYKVTHEMEGANHVLVLRLRGKETKTFRLACTMQPRNDKAPADEQHFRTENGQKLLTALVFEGDRYTHAF